MCQLRYDEIDQSVFCVLIMAWIMMDAAIILTLCVQCEKFYLAVEEAESTCIQLIMSRNSSKNHKHLCKRVLHLSRTFTKMSACGLFTVDASLPMPLIRLILVTFLGIITPLWMIKDVVVMLKICAGLENFYKSIEEVKSTCILFLMNEECSAMRLSVRSARVRGASLSNLVRARGTAKGEKYLCKRVLHLSRTFTKMSACGLFPVDASLPMPLIGLITHYMIVLLQFAFL
ncbi:uncharacterized protein LOC111350589 [Spodoptera litura]|uniref:Uncharacterized protein LOC111350589 n=1 Tax=Spodoptera litura TaxID=69820 RepID=A0A9J7DWN1_SPOLT|nr:uncharacterized protein LOC111350589 [Spodoptera litura]